MRHIFVMQIFISLGNSFVGIFLPFLIMDRFGLSFSEILFLIGLQHGIMGLLVYPAHKIKWLQIQHKLSLGILFLFLAIMFLSLCSPQTYNLVFIIGLSALSATFLWPAFHWVNVNLVDAKTRGNFLGNIQALMMGSLLLGPVLSGFIIDLGLSRYILWFTGLLYFFALLAALKIPVKTSPTAQSSHEITPFFKEQIKQKSYLNATLVESIQTASLMLVYPILLSITLKNYTLMGSMFFLMALIEIFSAKFFGKITDKYDSQTMIKWGALARFLDIAPRGLLTFFPSQIFAGILSISAGILGPLFGVSFYAQLYKRAEQSSNTYSFLITREWILGFTRFLFFTVVAISFYHFNTLALAIALFFAGITSFFLKKM